MTPGVVTRQSQLINEKKRWAVLPWVFMEWSGSAFFDDPMVICCANVGKAFSSSRSKETEGGGGGGVEAAGAGAGCFCFLLRLDFGFGEGRFCCVVEARLSFVDEPTLVTDVERGLGEDCRVLADECFDCGSEVRWAAAGCGEVDWGRGVETTVVHDAIGLMRIASDQTSNSLSLCRSSHFVLLGITGTGTILCSCSFWSGRIGKSSLRNWNRLSSLCIRTVARSWFLAWRFPRDWGTATAGSFGTAEWSWCPSWERCVECDEEGCGLADCVEIRACPDDRSEKIDGGGGGGGGSRG